MLRADPRLRRRALAGIAAVVVLAALGFVALSRYVGGLELLAATDPAAAVRRLVRLATLVTALLGAGAAAAGLYFFDLSRRALAAGCFPPPGTWLVSDTPVLRGAAARRKARLGAILALLLVAIGVAAPFLAALVIRRVAARQLARPRVDRTALYSADGSGIGRPKPPSTEAAIQAASA